MVTIYPPGTVMEIWRLKYWTHICGHGKKDERRERGRWRERESGRGKGRERGRGKKMEREKGKRKGKGRWKEDSLR